MIGIYKITNPNSRVYIGQSLNVELRLARYKNMSQSVKKQVRIYRSLIKHGAENHVFEIIEECNPELLNERERYWQEFYDVCDKHKGMNCTYQNTKGKIKVYTDELKAKIGNSNRGKKRTETAKANMRKSFKNRKPTFGYRHTKETRALLSQFATGNKYNVGRIYSQKERIDRAETKAILQGKMTLNTETGIYYPSLAQAAFSLGIHYSFLAKMLKGVYRNKTSFIYV